MEQTLSRTGKKDKKFHSFTLSGQVRAHWEVTFEQKLKGDEGVRPLTWEKNIPEKRNSQYFLH